MCSQDCEPSLTTPKGNERSSSTAQLQSQISQKPNSSSPKQPISQGATGCRLGDQPTPVHPETDQGDTNTNIHTHTHTHT